MVLRYHFHKEKLKDGSVAYRPLVLVDISYDDNHLPFSVAALLDSGCDVTIIPESFAKLIGLKGYGETELIAYREKTKVKTSKADIAFLSRASRENVKISSVPIFITPENDDEFLPEVVIGIRGIFDKFEIKFNLGQNRIELKKMHTLRRILIDLITIFHHPFQQNALSQQKAPGNRRQMVDVDFGVNNAVF